MTANGIAHARFKLRRTGIVVGLVLPLLALANPPPLIPPLPSGALPGGAQPIVPPPIMPLPQTNLQIDIPPLAERPLRGSEGARVFVRRFVISGVIGDRPAGIIPAAVQAVVDARFARLEALVNSKRKLLQESPRRGPKSLRPVERRWIAQRMQKVAHEPEAARKQAYRQRVRQWIKAHPPHPRGFTIGELQDVADAVTQYYHAHGYFLARAIIPAQQVNDGVVHIRVFEGRLEKVLTVGNHYYSSAILARPFRSLIGNLVTIKQTESALLALAQYPGLSAFGVFRPGDYVGTTDMLVNVQRENPYDATVRADNAGSAYTGRNRLIGTVDWNNPTGHADLLRITALKAFAPNNSVFGDILYEHPFFDPADSISLDVNKNSFDVSGSGITPGTIGGISKSATVSLKHAFERSRDENVSGAIDLSRKRAETMFRSKVIGQDDMAVLGFQLNYDSISPSLGIISTGYLRLDRGLPGILGVPSDAAIENKQVSPPPSRFGSDGKAALPSFTRLTLNYQIYKSLPANQALLLRFDGQYSPDVLMSLEQFVIGGADSVRAVPTSQFLTDEGLFGSLEYSVRAPGFADAPAFDGFTWGQVLRLRVFTDAAVGITNKAVPPNPSRVAVEGSGLGIEFTWPGRFSADLQWAHLNGGARPGVTASDPTAIHSSSQIWADVTFSF